MYKYFIFGRVHPLDIKEEEQIWKITGVTTEIIPIKLEENNILKLNSFIYFNITKIIVFITRINPIKN